MDSQNTIKGVVFDFLDVTSLSDHDIAQAFEKMSLHRQNRIIGFARDEDVRRSIGADLLGRLTAARFTGLTPDDIMIIQYPTGQPALKDIDCHISLSHAGNYAMCAVSSRPVGADIESTDRNVSRVCRKICSDEEQQYIFASGQFSTSRFAVVWTAKEAVLKMDGHGLSAGIGSIIVADSSGLIPSTEKYELISGIYCGMVYSVAVTKQIL